MKNIGLVVNPIAGMGGKVGLKGTDGRDILEEARALGSQPEAGIKAVRALKKLHPLKDELTILVANGVMGEDVVKAAGLNYEVVYESIAETNSNDTKVLCNIFEERAVDLIIFVSGDGTARDICQTIEGRIPVIGVPAGVKIYSSVFGNSPESAGQLAYEYLSGRPLALSEAEVIDLDEEGFRQDEVDINIYGYMTVPYDESNLQHTKSSTPQSDGAAQESIALSVIDSMDADSYYLMSSGTTISKIMSELMLDHTVLGIDIIRNKKLVAKDVNEQEILDILGDEQAKLILTPMGGQGYILGRANQQLSARVLAHVDQKDITIVATSGKLRTIGARPFLIYTLDDETDERLTAYYRVITSYRQEAMHKAESLK